MSNLIYLAWRQIAWNWWKSILLVAALALLIFAPIASREILELAGREWQERAATTPLVIGTRGSRTDLVIHSLYFTRHPDGDVTMAESNSINESDYGLAVPIYLRHTARDFPLIGTTFDYFDQRRLKIADGRFMTILGECVIGHDVARQLNLSPGDTLLSDPENVFDIAGAQPLRMQVAGVLEKNGTPEDRAVFVDINTSWIITGIGHGHENLDETSEGDGILSVTEGTVTASGALAMYQEINVDNVGNFHFHLEEGDRPVTSVLVFPVDERGKTILRGRYQSERQNLQAVQPTVVMEELLDQVLKQKKLLDGFLILLSTAMVFLLLIIFLLSLRLRKREFEVLNVIGCGLNKRLLLPLVEWMILLVFGAFASIILVLLARHLTPFLTTILIS